MAGDRDIIDAYEKDELEQLVGLLKQSSFDKLREWIENHTAQAKSDEATQLLKAIFKGCSEDKNNLSCHAHAAYTHCLKLLSSDEIAKEVCEEVLAVLLLEVAQLSTGGIVDMSKLLIQMIRSGDTGNGYAIEVFPKLLSLIEQKHEVHLGAGQGSMVGYEYRKHVLNNLFSGKWSNKSVLQLIKVFRVISMNPEELNFFLTKALKQLESMELKEIPGVIKQMLLIVEIGSHETLLRGIFNTLEKIQNAHSDGTNVENNEWSQMFRADSEDETENPVTRIFGEVLEHLFNAARRDQAVGKSLVKILKIAKEAISEGSVTSLSIGLALCAAQMQAYQDSVLDVLKGIVFRCFAHEHKVAHSNWLKERLVTVPDLRKMFLTIIKSCERGWQLTIPGIYHLGFTLMDAYAPRGGAFGKPLEEEPVREDSPQQACRDLGGRLVACMFREHQETRTEIIEQILNRVITKATTPIHHYIDVLKGVAKRYPETLLDCKDKLKEFLDHICLLSTTNADCVLQALLPLIKTNTELKNAVILVLRRALFTGQLTGRIIACNGFLLLLQNFKVKGYVSLSQTPGQSSMSIFSLASQSLGGERTSFPDQSNPGDDKNQSLCLEVLSSMRRCLSQQSEVRTILYQGLWNVIVRNAHLAGPIIEKLLAQFRLFYEDHDGIIPPVKINSCIKMVNGEPVMMEPLPLTMSALFLCLRKGQDCQKLGGLDDDDLIDEHLISSVRDIFQSLTNRLAKSEMDDFELDKSADFTPATSVGKKNLLTAGLVLGCYRAVIEYNLMQEQISEESADKILRLHSSYKKIHDAVCSGKKDSAKVLPVRFPASPEFVKLMANRLLVDVSPDNEVGLNVLRTDGDFVRFAMDAVLYTVTHAKDHGVVKSIGGLDKSCIREMCITVGQACLKKFMMSRNEPYDSAVCQYCLEIFRSTLQYIVVRKNKRLEEFLTSTSTTMTDDSTSTGVNVQDKHIRRFQRIVMTYLSEDTPLSAWKKKILTILISILETLSFVTCEQDNEEVSSQSATPYHHGISQVNEWVGKLCKERVIDDNAVTKSLVSLHLQLSVACGPSTGAHRTAQGSEGAVRDIATDIHLVTGDIDAGDEDSQMDGDKKTGSNYPIIDQGNVIFLVPLVISHIDAAVEETDWLLQRLRGQVSLLLAEEKFCRQQSCSETGEESKFHIKRKKIESAVCTRLGSLLLAYREHVKSGLPLGAPSESVFRGLTKIFNLLTNFTKYYAWIISQGVTKAPMPRFETLMKLMGTELTRYVYPFINHIESLQSSRTASAAKKRRRKEAKENATNAEKQKVLRETKSIPPLIYAIENLERFLMTLGKKCKINLLSGHKLPTSRDFRIRGAVLKEALARKDENVQETQDSSSDSDEGDPNASKRARADSPT